MKMVFLFIVLVFMTCKSQKHRPDIDGRLVLLTQDDYFPIEHPETHIITNSKSLRAFFSKVNQTRKPGLPVPEVDFKTSSVLVACMGGVNTNALPVMRLKSETPDEMIISVHIAGENGKSGVNSFPFCVYAIADEGKKITLEME